MLIIRKGSTCCKLIILHLDFNHIEDISPLVNNPGIGSGDRVNLFGNPLNQESINELIPILLSRGVNIVGYRQLINGFYKENR